MSIQRTKQPAVKGFTLVELLVVMAISGVVVMAIYSLHRTSLRSATTQDEVVELQQNLRIALDQMARDVRLAGFMVPSAQTALSSAAATSLTLRLGTVTGQVARVDGDFTSPTDAATARNVGIASAEMVDMFDSGEYVRIIRPEDGSQPLDRVLEVASKDRTVPRLVLKGFNSAREYLTGDILVRVLDANTDIDFDPNTNSPAYPATVSYALVDDPDSADPAMQLLQRTATGLSAETVAIKVTALAFSYLLEDGTETNAPTDLGQIRAVRITLTGATDATKTGSAQYSGVKTRRVTSVVKIRNI